ncbi:hypothetical protein ACFQE1_04320 [Halobium palmae]|uniref:Uncharacterized protein n=1 Tax=Halobium palmae TaxID=1776492 RepID=A0ABD5RW10_9EURY
MREGVAADVDAADPVAARAYLASHSDSPVAIEQLLEQLRYGALCSWCFSHLRPSPACRPSAPGAGRTWVADGLLRYCDREQCGERASLDGPDPTASRDKGQLFDHYHNALASLEEFYALESNGFAVDVDAGEGAIREACRDRRSGEGVRVIAEAITASLSRP